MLAVIATYDQAYGIKMARLLLFNTLPFVNGDAVNKFIAAHEDMAREYGEKSGVFITARETKSTGKIE